MWNFVLWKQVICVPSYALSDICVNKHKYGDGEEDANYFT